MNGFACRVELAELDIGDFPFGVGKGRALASIPWPFGLERHRHPNMKTFREASDGCGVRVVASLRKECDERGSPEVSDFDALISLLLPISHSFKASIPSRQCRRKRCRKNDEHVLKQLAPWRGEKRFNHDAILVCDEPSVESSPKSGRQHCPVSRCERTGSGLLKYRNTASLRSSVNRVAAREGGSKRSPVYCAETRQARISRRSRQHLLPTRRVKVGLHGEAFASKRVHERVLGQDAVARLQPLHAVKKFGLSPRADGFRHFIAPVDFARAKPAPGAGGCQLEKNGRF